VVNVSAAANSGYQFVNWTGSVANANNAATTVTISAPVSVTANFQQVASITVAASTAGPSFTVDGTSYTTSQTSLGVVGQLAYRCDHGHRKRALAGTQYVFNNWSDSGALSHTVLQRPHQ